MEIERLGFALVFLVKPKAEANNSPDDGNNGEPEMVGHAKLSSEKVEGVVPGKMEGGLIGNGVEQF